MGMGERGWLSGSGSPALPALPQVGLARTG